MEDSHHSSPEQVDFPPIEVPLSPLHNGQIPHFTMECGLPGTPMRNDGTSRTDLVETIGPSDSNISTMDSASSKEIELSETSSNISAESNLLLPSSKPDNSRGSVKRKKFLNTTRSNQMDVELKVIQNGHIYDQDNNNQTASC